MAVNWFGGAAFPTRGQNTPNSGQVMSDGEFNQGWEGKLATVPQYFAGASRPTFTNVQDLYKAGQVDQANALVQRAAAENLNYKWEGRGGTTLAGDFNPGNYMVQTGMEAGPQELNPEWARINNDFQSARGLRSENQTRQQQAYNTTMAGNGAFGGVLPANYTDPNYGQVTGQKTGGLGSLGGADLTGIGSDNQTGAYSGGSGSYNLTPFAAGWQSNKTWGGF
jgi:hypothetical protein